MSYLPYSIVLVLASFISIGLGIYGFLHRDRPGMAAFSIFMFLSAVWPMAQAFDIATADLTLKIFLMKIRLDAPVFAILAYFVMVIQLIGKSNWITKQRLVFLSIIPIIGIFFNWTSPNLLFRYGYHIITGGPFPVLAWTNGPFFIIWILYIYALFLVPLFLLINSYRSISPLTSRQVIILIIATSIPVVINALFQIGITPISGFNLEPIAQVFEGLIIVWGVFYVKAFDTVPIARDKLITDMKESVMVVDPQNRILDMNPSAFNMIGSTADKAIGQLADEVFAFWPDLLVLFKDVKDEQIEIKLDKNPIRYFDVNISSLRDKNGQYLGRMFILRDISKRKYIDNELKESEIKYRSLYSSMSEGVALHNIIYNQYKKPVNYIISDINQSYENIIGLKRDEIVGKKASEVYSTNKPPYMEIYAKVAETGESIQFETYFEPMNKYFNISVTSIEKGKFYTVFEDITESKIINNALRESEERFRNLADNIPNLAWMAEANGGIFWYNKQWYEYTGTTLKEMEGWGWQKVLHPDYVKKVTEDWNIKIKEEEPYDNIFPLKGKDGNYRWFLTRITPIRDDHGKLMRWFGTNTDITDRVDREKELETLMTKLEHSNKELEQFAYITSHDLREPLRMITSFLQLLERRYKDQLDQDANEFIEFAVNGAKRLDAMTNDLLQYSKITSKERELSPINFNYVLEEALTNLKVPIDENNAVITYDQLPTINGDEQLTVQLFQNLIGNAIKYRSQENPKIHISTTKEKNQYLFSIKDNGIGMSPEHLKRIFTIFQRLHTREEYEGTGIGLAIAQKIIHQQGGRIWVESKLGKGSTFYFTIPIKN